MIQESQTDTASTPSGRAGIAFTAIQVVLGILGTIDAGLLYMLDTKRVDLPCTADGGCEKVADSIYSQVHPFGHTVPIALLGVVGYVVILSLAMAKAASETKRGVDLLSMALTLVTGGAFLYSWFLQYVSFTMIHAHCMYCIISACLMTVLFITCVLERRALARSV